MGPPEGEVDQLGAMGSDPAPRGLARHRRLEREQVQQPCLDQLCLGYRSGHLEKRLPSEDDPPLGNCPHLAGEPGRTQRRQRRCIQIDHVTQIVDLLVVELEPLEEGQRVRQPGGHQKPSLRR